MSMAQVKASDVIRKLVWFKIVSYSGMLWSLIILQVLAMLMSFNMFSSGGSMGGGFIRLSYQQSSPTIIFIFTLIWIFISAILMTTKSYQFDDYSFITTRVTSSAANGIILIFASLTGALTTILSSFVYQLTFTISSGAATTLIVPVSFGEYVTGGIAAFFYLLLAAAAGYLTGTLFQEHVFIRVGTAIVLIVVLFGRGEWFVSLFASFFLQEMSIILFILKILLVSSLFYGLSMLLFIRQEVAR